MMKIGIFAIFCCLLFDTKIYAEELDKIKLDAAVLSAIPAFWLQIFVHERTHAAMAKSQGAKITNFHIAPITKNGKDYWGYTGIEYLRPPSDRQLAFFSISPLISDAIIFSATEIAFASGGINRDIFYAPATFVIGEVAPWIDFTVNILRGSDIAGFSQNTGFPETAARIIGGFISAAGLYFLIERGKSIFRKNTRPIKRHSVMLSPFSDIGAALTYRF